MPRSVRGGGFGLAHRQPMAMRWGGGAVVVRAGESLAHGGGAVVVRAGESLAHGGGPQRLDYEPDGAAEPPESVDFRRPTSTDLRSMSAC
jgi:hypothetical protein